MLTKKHSISRIFFNALLIMFAALDSYTFSQTKDTVTINDESLTDIIYYSARDSIFSDLKNKKVHLFGDAKVSSADITITAGYILIDLDKNEVLATYSYTKDNVKTEFPKFTDGSEEIKASTIRYNFDSEKGYIEDLAVKQDELYLYMGVAKRHPDDQIHFKEGRFTTCDLEEPHYHFQLTKAVLIPDERIVTGPMNLWIKGVPTPFGLPFSLIPQQKERTHGILFPEISPLSNYGFGFQNLGYYFPINQRLQTSVYTTLYSRGSWGLRNNLEYAKRYGYRGNLDAGFQQFKSGFPENTNSNKVSVTWIHSKEPKSNPYWNFTSNVNFISDNESKNNLDPLNEQYFNNSFNSDINITRSFPGKPMSAGAKMSVRQNSLTNNISLTSPTVSFNVTRFFPFKKIARGTSNFDKILKQIGMTYNFEGQNRSTFKDTLLRDGRFDEIGSQFINGMNQNVTIQSTSSFFKNTLKFTPSFAYTNKVNFQQIDKSYILANDSTVIDTIQKTGMLHDLTFNAQFTTMVYSYYKFVGKKNSLMRHIMTPSIGFRYVPQLNETKEYVGIDSTIITYSPFERSIYTSSTGKTSSQLTFGVNNTFELKRRSDKDTVTGFKKTRIIDMLSITGSYDYLDSMELSDFAMNCRINPIEWFNFVANSTFSPYSWVDSTGATISSYAIFDRKVLGRFLRNDFTSTITLTSPEGRKKLQETKNQITENWNSDLNYYALHPEFIIDFEIPWKLSLSHVYSINTNTNKTTDNSRRYSQIQTLVVNWDVSFTKRWKLGSITNLDLKDARITNSRITLSRNLHCWALSFYWTPIGDNKSFLFSIRNTSSLLQDAKFEIRKPPLFL